MDIPKAVEHIIEKVDPDNQKSAVLLFLRQVLMSTPIIFNLLITGLYMGAPTVMIPQIRKESEEVITQDMVSWLSSLSSFSSIPWTIILPLIAHRFGRKNTLLFVNVIALIGNVVFYRSTTFTELLISQAIQGILMSSFYTIAIMILSEYTSPKYRGLMMTVKSATFFWGIWLSNTIGTFLHWRAIGIVIFVICIYNLLFCIIFCLESPYWLAMKGRFEECAKSHRWLKGTDPDSESELRNLILTQQSYINKLASRSTQRDNIIITIYKTITEKKFYKPLFYMTLAVALYMCSGKIACTVYAIDIIKKITSSEKTAYEAMLIIDGITVLCAYIGCFLTYVLKRRTHLLISSIIGVGFLFILSFYLYIIKLNYISENKYISIALLVGFSISLSSGPMILATCCFGEMAPVKNRSSFLIVFSLIALLLISSVLKITPFLFQYFESHGAFLTFGITASLIILGLYKYLPETKDRTLQEIENIIAGEKTVIEDTKETIPLKSVC